MIFAHLLLNQLHTVIEFLSTLNINGRNGLGTLLNTWLENHESFQGYYSIKVRYELLWCNCSYFLSYHFYIRYHFYSAIALSKLFLSGDSRIQGIQVKGDLVVTNSSSMYSHSIIY